MFILGSDGGLPSPDELSEEVREFESARILSQRHFLFVAVHSKTPIVLLSPAEFEDGKVRLVHSSWTEGDADSYLI